jgi:hypothetical protein
MGNNIINNFNNFCGCRENEDTDNEKLEKVSLFNNK